MLDDNTPAKLFFLYNLATQAGFFFQVFFGAFAPFFFKIRNEEREREGREDMQQRSVCTTRIYPMLVLLKTFYCSKTIMCTKIFCFCAMLLCAPYVHNTK